MPRTGQTEHPHTPGGGAPANVAVGLARLGVASAFIGMVGVAFAAYYEFDFTVFQWVVWSMAIGMAIFLAPLVVAFVAASFGIVGRIPGPVHGTTGGTIHGTGPGVR